MDEIKEFLLSNRDDKYRDFTLPLIPNVDKESFIGVRLPILKKYAKELDETKKSGFLACLPHKYHEENILHALILSNIKDYKEFIELVDKFLPFVTNWAVCDAICNKHLNKHKDEFLPVIYSWLKSNDIYRVRYAVKCLMSYYLGEDFSIEHIEEVKKIKLDDYYIEMMIAWYLATGLAKNYSDFIKVIEDRDFSPSIHNKTIQKAVDSYRVSDDHKNYLKTLKIRDNIKTKSPQ